MSKSNFYLFDSKSKCIQIQGFKLPKHSKERENETKEKTKNENKLHQPGIEPGSVPWQGTILPLDHWCFATSKRHYKMLYFKINS